MSKFPEKVISRLEASLGKENVYIDMPHRAVRAAVPAPFPLVLWDNHIPDVVVMPKNTDEVVEIVKIANEYKVPIVPRAGATGLADGAVPLRKGILLDIKRMNDILEIDELNMSATVQTGIGMMELNKVLGRLGILFPDDPASYTVAHIGGRIGTGGWSLSGGSYGHIPDLVTSMEVVLPTGKVIRVGEGGAQKIRKSSVGFRMKDLFIGNQGTLGIVTEATLSLFVKPEVECPQYFGFSSFEESHEFIREIDQLGLRTHTACVIFDPEKVKFLRRDDEAYIPQPKEVVTAVLVMLHGTEAEVLPAQEKVWEVVSRRPHTYLGDLIAKGDWASRHDRYHITYHGRNPQGDVHMLNWHCEDCAIPYSELPVVRKKWHEIVKKYMAEYPGYFDDWGMFMYSNGSFGKKGDYLAEIDVGFNERECTVEVWDAYKKMGGDIARIAVEVGGSLSACHGGTRPGQEEVSTDVELCDGSYDLMKKIKKLLDPNNIMNPGKYMLDKAYE